MRSVNGFFLFDLGQIWQLTRVPPGVPIQNSLELIAQCLYTLRLFVEQPENRSELPDSVYEATELMNILNALIQRPGDSLTANESGIIFHLLARFRAIFNSELGKIFTFVVEEKRGFNSATLWRNSLKLFSDDVVPALSDFVKTNLEEAAKCLLLDRYTAVGFHVMRSVECVARSYYALVTGIKPPYRNKDGDEYFKTFGTIVRELKNQRQSLEGQHKAFGSLALITGNLEPLCNIYRNPLSHPEIKALDQNEAINALLQSITAIETMVLDAQKGGDHITETWISGFSF